ncbi:restriction endonuclease subunit S [Aeromonas taiwanensis]|uniref:restriction endonuclease subunit S n=1 Tax=Aeromonas taiwanensis TaxID=633417 RepID=UPI003988F9EC
MSEEVATSQQELVEKYQPYPEYDDSGIEWLGRIPVHWKLATLKHECVFSGGGTPTKDNLAYWGGDIPWISPKDMKSLVVTDSIDKITAVAVAESSTKLVPEGALLMVVRSGILQRTIPVAINTVPVTLNQDMKALRFKSKDKACFFLYYIQGLESQLLLEWCKQGATVESIEHELLANARYPLPPNDELKAINQFLDYETARIDRLIAQQLRLIELLKEKRQAVISHAVTKGLNPYAPMIDSGVEWLGQVPEHWSVVKLSYVLSLKSGDGITSNEIEPEGAYPVYGGNGLRGYCEQFNCNGTYALIGRQGALCGNVNVADGKFFASEHAVVVYPRIQFDVRFLSEFLRFMDLGQYSVSAAQPGISVERINMLSIAVPPIEEQSLIGQRISQVELQIERLVVKAEAGVLLLKERRTALISAAVTGKIDLRGWIPPSEEAAA